MCVSVIEGGRDIDKKETTHTHTLNSLIKLRKCNAKTNKIEIRETRREGKKIGEQQFSFLPSALNKYQRKN